jgi:hypothetical protein
LRPRGTLSITAKYLLAAPSFLAVHIPFDQNPTHPVFVNTHNDVSE